MGLAGLASAIGVWLAYSHAARRAPAIVCPHHQYPRTVDVGRVPGFRRHGPGFDRLAHHPQSALGSPGRGFGRDRRSVHRGRSGDRDDLGQAGLGGLFRLGRPADGFDRRSVAGVCGYLALRRATIDPEKRAARASILGIIAVIQVPLVYFSVNLMRSLHQTQSVRPGGATMHPTMLRAMLFNLGAFTLVYVALMSARMVIARLDDEVRAPTDGGRRQRGAPAQADGPESEGSSRWVRQPSSISPSW